MKLRMIAERGHEARSFLQLLGIAGTAGYYGYHGIKKAKKHIAKKLRKATALDLPPGYWGEPVKKAKPGTVKKRPPA